MRYTELARVSDQDGSPSIVRGLHHDQESLADAVDQRPAYELTVASHGTWNTADPLGRAEVQRLVEGLLTAIAHGISVELTGVPAYVAELGPLTLHVRAGIPAQQVQLTITRDPMPTPPEGP